MCYSLWESVYKKSVPDFDKTFDKNTTYREYDEHVWLSLKNASALTSVIAETLAELDPSNAEAYMSNAKAYEEAIDALDLKYAETLENASFKTVLFGDRFPFRYLTDDYGLDYYAAFAGCSAETEASFETIAFLSQKVNELELPAIFTIEGTDHRIAETIAQNAGDLSPEILSLNSMQATTLADANAGVSYLSIMEKNLEILSEALS